MLRVVIDTNVIVSGILSRTGAPAELLNAWRQRRFLLLSSPAIVAEVRAVLQYPRIRKKYPLSDEEIELSIYTRKWFFRNLRDTITKQAEGQAPFCEEG